MNSKTAFRNTMKLMNSERPVFIPFAYGLAAKIGQIPLQEMVSDPGYYSHLLEDTQELFKYDGIVNHFDTTIDAECFGCEIEWADDYVAPEIKDCSQVELREIDFLESARIQVLLEATKRVVISKGKANPVIGTVNGPVSLAKTLSGDNTMDIENVIATIGSFLIKLVRSLCELRVDSIFFREDSLGAGYREGLQAYREPYKNTYTTLFNLVKHYDASPVLIVRDIEMDFISDLHRTIGLSGMVLLGQRFTGNNLEYLQKLSESLKVSFGLPLSFGDSAELSEQFTVISQYVNKYKPTGFFYVSDGDIPHDVSPEIIHNLVGKIGSG